VGKTTETIRWSGLEGFSRYEISDVGLVRNIETKTPMCDYDDGKNGYRKIKLTDDTGKCVMFYGHRINNALDNLMSVTHRQNSVLKKQRNSAYLFNRKDGRRKKEKRHDK